MEYNKIHMIGIAGVGMSALAQMLVDQGKRVTGSDNAWFPTLEKIQQLGIEVPIGYDPKNVPEDTECVIYTDAAPEGNPERVAAAERGIPQLSYFQGLGEVAKGRRVVAVAGTHGKTTTAGMLARILRDANVSPTAVVGSLVQDFGSNYLSGTSDWFVVEACEYRRHFLNLSPEILVVTNLEFDHTDYFRDLVDVQDAFRTLMEKVPAEGTIITDPANPNIAPLLLGVSAKIVDYTREPEYEIRFPGEFNEMNARAAAAAARAVVPAIAAETVATSLKEFRGTWRRFEYKGKSATGADVYDDYAHHPTAIEVTLAELRKRAKGKVFVAFHPHLYSRTRDLFEGFAAAFKDADLVLLAPIYAARETNDTFVSSELLAERINANGTPATAFDSFEHIEAALGAAGPGDIVMTMGAGDIYKVADALVAKGTKAA